MMDRTKDKQTFILHHTPYHETSFQIVMEKKRGSSSSDIHKSVTSKASYSHPCFPHLVTLDQKCMDW